MKKRSIEAVVKAKGGAREIATKMGVSVQVVYVWMEKNRIPTTEHAFKFAEVTGIDPKELA